MKIQVVCNLLWPFYRPWPFWSFTLNPLIPNFIVCEWKMRSFQHYFPHQRLPPKKNLSFIAVVLFKGPKSGLHCLPSKVSATKLKRTFPHRSMKNISLGMKEKYLSQQPEWWMKLWLEWLWVMIKKVSFTEKIEEFHLNEKKKNTIILDNHFLALHDISCPLSNSFFFVLREWQNNSHTLTLW